MRRWLGPLVVLLVCAAAVHLAVLRFAPGLIMTRAMDTLAARGVVLHRFTAPLRVTPQTQSVVRSSPDLYYALCRYDLRNPGTRVTVRMGAWPDYQSLSFFDARTVNFATLRGRGEAVAVRLLPPGSASEAGAIVSPTVKGVILVRRLAPDAARFAAAAEAGKADQCRLEWKDRVAAPGQG
ncbi:MAG: putative integral membrane protein [Porphyrobacter sp. HL-46]|nr:MAG: putative integral membrane protein [Porphyrobacter sp. HL-46]